MKKYKLYKNNNFIRLKALSLAGFILLGSTSCSKKKEEIAEPPKEIIVSTLNEPNNNEITNQINVDDIDWPVIYHEYDLNNYEYNKNEITFFNTEFTPSENLYNELTYLMKNYSSGASFIVVNLNDGMSFGYNVDNSYWSASTIKGAYVLYVCKLIDEGKASLDDKITVTSKYNSGGSGNIQYMSRGTVLTLKDVIYHTINVSDNQGYHMLHDKFGSKEFNEMLINLGCEDMVLPSYSRFTNVNCRSFALIWQEMMNYFKTETETSKFLYETILNAQYNYLKDGISDKPSLHKSGWYDDIKNPYIHVCNDTGVILDEENPYIIITLTKNNGRYQIRRMAETIDKIMEEYGLYLKENYTKIYSNKGLIYKKK